MSGVPPDLLVVAAVVVIALAATSAISAWADRRRPVVALLSLAMGAVLLFGAHLALSDGLGWRDIPESFVLVAARILN